MGKRGIVSAVPRPYWKDILMQLKAPQGVTAIEAGGESYAVDDDGFITAHCTGMTLGALRAAGFTDAPEPVATTPDVSGNDGGGE